MYDILKSICLYLALFVSIEMVIQVSVSFVVRRDIEYTKIRYFVITLWVLFYYLSITY